MLGLLLFLQATGNVIVSSPSSSSSSSPAVTVIDPKPDPALVAQTAEQGAPFALAGGFSSFDTDAAARASTFLNFGNAFAQFRQNLVNQPRVHQVNSAMARLVLGLLGLTLAALALWGIFGQLVGSDWSEAVETLARVPLWALIAVTSYSWLLLLMQVFGIVGAALSSTLQGTFGPPLGAGAFDVPLGPLGPTNLLAQLVLGALYILAVLWLVLELFIASVLLALMAAIAPLLIFAAATPWTRRFASRWWHVTTGTMVDLVLMGAVIGLGGPILEQFGQQEPFTQMLLRLGLIFVLFRVRSIFGLHYMGGSSILSTLFLARMLATRGAAVLGAGRAAGSAVATGPGRAAEPVPRAPRYSTLGGVSGRNGGQGPGSAAWGKA
jgi:hypothetical protein